MTQYPGTYGSEFADANQPAKTSGLAISALVLSLILCCPVTTVIGLLLGVIAFVSIGSNPMRRGRGMAIAAIIIGLLATCGWAWLIYFMTQSYGVFSVAPAEALRAGYSGNLTQFKSDFGGSGTAVSDAEAQAFIDALRSRYGQIQTSKLDWAGFQQLQQAKSGSVQPLAYTLIFDNATMSATVTLNEQHQPGGKKFVFDSITIHDAAKGDITYPPGAPPVTRTAPGAAAPRGSMPPPAGAPTTTPATGPSSES